jgi:hypothetical protein
MQQPDYEHQKVTLSLLPMPYCAVENAMFYQKILSYLPTKFIDTVTLFFSTAP